MLVSVKSRWAYFTKCQTKAIINGPIVYSCCSFHLTKSCENKRVGSCDHFRSPLCFIFNERALRTTLIHRLKNITSSHMVNTFWFVTMYTHTHAHILYTHRIKAASGKTNGTFLDARQLKSALHILSRFSSSVLTVIVFSLQGVLYDLDKVSWWRVCCNNWSKFGVC